LNGIRGSVPVSESLTNLGIDAGAMALMITLWNLEQKAKVRRSGGGGGGEERLAMMVVVMVVLVVVVVI